MTIIATEGDFIPGTLIQIGGESSIVGPAEPPSTVHRIVIPLVSPLTSDHPAGSNLVQKPRFAELTVRSDLAIRPASSELVLPVIGTLTIDSSGSLALPGDFVLFDVGGDTNIAGHVNAADGIGFDVGGDTNIAGHVNAAQGISFETEGNIQIGGTVLSGREAGFQTFSGQVSVNGSVSAMREVVFSAFSGSILLAGSIAGPVVEVFSGGGLVSIAPDSLSADLIFIFGRQVTAPHLTATGGINIRASGSVDLLSADAGHVVIDGDDITTGPLTATKADGSITVFGLGVHTGELTARENITIFARRDVRTGPVSAGGAFFGMISSGSSDSSFLVDGPITGGVVLIGNPAGHTSLLGPIEAAGIVALDIAGDLELSFPVVARNEKVADLFLPRGPGISLTADKLDIGTRVSAPTATICVSAADINVQQNATLSALQTQWVSSGISFAGGLAGTGGADSIHLFRLPSRSALSQSEGAAISPQPVILEEAAPAAVCGELAEYDLSVTLTPPEQWDFDGEKLTYKRSEPVFRGEAFMTLTRFAGLRAS